MAQYIILDIGGTQIRAACFPTESQIPTKVVRIPTQGDGIPPLDRLTNLIAEVWPSPDAVAAIGVAAAGPLDPYAGIVIEAPNIPGWINVPLQKHLENRFHVPVYLGNDANMAALGEWKYGAGRGHHHLIYMTISTGIGGGIIVDDQLLLGTRGFAGELGHITVLPDGPLCGCGQRGHLEALASGPAIALWAENELKCGVASILPSSGSLTAKDVGHAAEQGDPLALAALSRAGHFLGIALANYLHIFNSSIIILGGGVSKCGYLLIQPLKTSIAEHVLSIDYFNEVTITTAALGDDAGLMGALALTQARAGR